MHPAGDGELPAQDTCGARRIRFGAMSLPRWMEPLLEAGESRELDRWAINERKIATEELMERAGEGLAGVVARRAPAGRIAIVCGKGNNGGDGYGPPGLPRHGGRGGG